MGALVLGVAGGIGFYNFDTAWLLAPSAFLAVFGASALTDAFFVAFRLPNLLRRLFAEGAFQQAFVPILAEARNTGAENSRRLLDHVASVLFWALLAVTLLGVVGAPALVYLIAGGLADEPASFAAAVTMTRWMFPYILLISLVALAGGILNTWQRFALPAFTPVLLNLCFIAAALLLAPRFDPPVYALAVGVMAGGLAQLAIQLPALSRLGLLPRIGIRLGAALRDPLVRRMLTNMAPAVLAVSVAQISLVINTNIASRLTTGSVSWISYADRLMEFPTALLGVALGTVLLPSLSRAHADGDPQAYSGLLDWGLRLVVLLALPCMAGMAVMAEPLTAMLFHYGRFSDTDLAMTRLAVSAYAAGLIGLIAIKILAPGFYARQDMRTPVRIALLVLVGTQLMNLVLVPWLAHAGLALAISVGAWLNAGLLLAGLLRRGVYRPAPGWRAFCARVLAAVSAMTVTVFAINSRFDWVAMQAEPLLRIGAALGIVALGGACYGLVLLVVGIRPKHFLRATG
ncbi:MAG: murein biosynthesis integral membrane protein MurJ [Burkholderiales bacterium]|nr:MAG: murein biosynthesis integral membrane protein MurJ [Burkholderiales bacterium]